MNRRQAKKREKKQALEYLKYLDKYFDESEKKDMVEEGRIKFIIVDNAVKEHH